MKAALWGIAVGISMAFSFRKDGKIDNTTAGVSISTQILTIIIFSLPSFL